MVSACRSTCSVVTRVITTLVVALAVIGLTATRATAQNADNPYFIEGKVQPTKIGGPRTDAAVPANSGVPQTNVAPCATGTGASVEACQIGDLDGNAQEL